MNTEISSILRLNGWAGRVVLLVYGLGTAVVAVLKLRASSCPRWALSRSVSSASDSPSGLSAEGSLWASDGLLAAVAAISVVLTVVAGQEVARVINDVLRQSAALIIGTLFAIVLRRATLTIASLRSHAVSRAAVEAAAATAIRERETQNVRLEQDSRPALERIISTTPFSPRDLEGFRALSATLRGGIQPTGSSGSRIADAVIAARLEEALLPLLTEMQAGSVTVRLSPDGAHEIATLVIEERASTAGSSSR